MIRGLDVSAAQGQVDWPSIAALGCRFAVIKCSEGNRGSDPNLGLPSFAPSTRRALGTSGQDAQFNRNVTGAKAAGLAIGAYHFAYPLPDVPGSALRSPAVQAKFAFDLCNGLGSDPSELPPVLDFEWPAPNEWVHWNCSAHQLQDWALAYLDAAAGFWGCLPLLYTYPDFWMHVGGGTVSDFAKYPLWMASYPNAPHWPEDGEKPLVVRPWTDWTVWQFTGGAMKLPNGVPADFDVMKSEEALQALCKATDPDAVV